MQMAYWQDAISLAQDQMTHWMDGKPMPISDRRFSSEEWVNNPFFNFMSQHYLLASEHMNSLLEHIEYGDKQLARRCNSLPANIWMVYHPPIFCILIRN